MKFREALISTSDQCGVGCKFCFRADVGENWLDLETHARVLSVIRGLGVESVCLTGGEPSDHPELESIVGLTRQFGIACSIVTAGRRGKRLDRLRSVVPFLESLTISADSREVMSIGGTQRSVSSAIEAFTSLRPRDGIVHVVFYQLDEGEAEELRKAREELRVTIQFSPLIIAGDLMLMKGIYRTQYMEQLRRDVDLLERFDLVNDRFVDTFDEFCGMVDGTPPFTECRARRLYISASGDIRLCADSSAVEINVYRQREEIRKYFSSGLPELPVPCIECFTLCR